MVEVESKDYNGTINDGGCCVKDCTDTSSWKRVDQNPCNITLKVDADMEPPIYMYYKLTNYYQNHRRYVRSRSDQQLKGTDLEENDVIELEKRCMYHFKNSSGDLINPCGLIAWSLFNDSFTITSNADGAPVTLDTSSIAWESDLEQKFNNHADGTTGQNFPPFAFERSQSCSFFAAGTDERTACDDAQAKLGPDVGLCFPGSGYCTEDQHFVVWMRSAGLPSFRKLYAKIDTKIPKGTYTVTVSNGVYENGRYVKYLPGGGTVDQSFLYPVGAFGGTKTVVLSTGSWVGGRNFFLGYAYIVVGIVCVVLAICFFIKHRLSPRDLGNAPYVAWQSDAPPK